MKLAGNKGVTGQSRIKMPDKFEFDENGEDWQSPGPTAYVCLIAIGILAIITIIAVIVYC